LNPAITPKHALMKGAAWTIGLRWSVRALGFINTVIMARILVPADYGIVAMAFLILGLIQAVLDFGSATALLRKNEVTRDEIDSAWTFRVIEGVIIGILLAAGSPLAVWYFGEPRLGPVLWILAACIVVCSAANIGQTLAQKEFNFALDFKIQIIQKTVGVIVTVIAGLLLRDYRALVIGIVVMYLVQLFLSYALHPYRPRWNVSRIPEIWAVTKWLMFSGIGGYILSKGDELVAGRIGTTAQYGEYNVGADLGLLPVGEVGPAMLRALLPVLASIKEDVARTQSAVVKIVSALSTIIWPIGLGFAALAPQATQLILGNKWAGSAAIISAFAFASVLRTTFNPLNTLLILQGHTKTQMHIVWLEFVGFAIAAILLVPSFHLIGLVYARILGSFVNLTFTAIFSKRYCQLHLSRVFAAMARPVLGSTMVYLAVKAMVPYLPGMLTQVLVSVLSGAVIYIVWSLITWHIVGRPEGLESTVIDYANHKMRREKNA
jgi:lipopolysaccharide exporter